MPRLTSSPPHIHFFFYIPCLVFLCSLSHVAESQILDQEQQVLLKLRQSWQDPSSLDHWVASNSSSHCTWPDITCQEGSITELNLVNLNINYSIPPFICDLKNLTKLDISSNKIPGDFPTVLYNCSKLVYLDLSQNYFEGPIPSDIDRMANLQVLILAANSFAFDVPASISRLWRLRILHLYQSEYNGTYPQEIFSLSDLEELRLEFNGKFVPSQLPQNFTALKKLRFFSMAQTNLFGEIPETVGDMEGLEHLDLGMNLLTGEIPRNIFAPRNLSERYDEYTNFVSWKSLNVLNLSHNRLSGMIPREIGLLPVLTRLDLSENQLSGWVPPEIGLLKLNLLNLSSNRLSGRIPGELENAMYDTSFLNNPGLCASNSFMRLNVCNSQSSKLSKTNLALIVILAILGAIFVLLIVLFMIRASRKKGSPKPMLTFMETVKLSISDILGQLVEKNVIGRGGFGKVYSVKLTHSGETVAVKSISNNHNLGGELEKQFLAEVEALRNLSHENIINLLSYFSWGNLKLLVYEYMENNSLDHWLHKTNRSSQGSGVANNMILDWPKRLQIAQGAAEGLSYMHNDCSRPIIHRDVKSANILLDSGFNPKMADFGLARMLAKPGEADMMSAMLGSFGYIAPEYGGTGKFDEKCDVYSFGVVLLELITGRRATHGDEGTNLAQWATNYVKDGKPISDVIDEEINHDAYLDEISYVFKLGISCTATLPTERPTMKDVVQGLLKCRDPLTTVKKKFRHTFNVALLLGNSKKEEMPLTDDCVLRRNTH